MARAPLVTDEPVDRFVARPLARGVVWLVAKTPLTANQLTVLASVFGVAAGVAVAWREGWVAALCLLVYLVLDCADGQLARLRGGGNYLGRAVDGIGDYVTAVAVHLGLIAWLVDLVGWGPAIAWGVAAGLSMAWTSFLLDRYKRRYRGDEDDVEAMRREAEDSPGWRAWTIGTLLPYARRLDGDLVVPDHARYRERVRGPMLLWLIDGPTTHVSALAVCLVLGAPLVYAWIAVGPMTLLAVLALVWQTRLETREPPVVTRRG